MNDTLIKLFLEFVKTNLREDSEDIPSFSQIYKNIHEPILLSQASNSVQEQVDVVQHSEILAIQKAEKVLKTRYLENCLLITTLEPCLMCSGAILQSRVEEVWYFAEQTRFVGISQMEIEKVYKSNHFPNLKFIQDTELSDLMKSFFKKRRN